MFGWVGGRLSGWMSTPPPVSLHVNDQSALSGWALQGRGDNDSLLLFSTVFDLWN